MFFQKMNSSKTIEISVVIPTWKRTKDLIATIARIQSCDPVPCEIFVHIDAGDDTTASVLGDSYGDSVRTIKSESRMGPGGGRNLLIASATFDVIVSLDDDSWPVDVDFFAKVVKYVKNNKDVGIFAARILLPNEDPNATHSHIPERASCFENCGCIIRKDAFEATSGYLPLECAYGMEESDVSLQILDNQWKILYAPELAVFHNTDNSHHASKTINAGQIANIFLLVYIRYPFLLWGLVLIKLFKRVYFCISSKRFSGILLGIGKAPRLCWRFREQRSPVSFNTILFSKRRNK